MADSAPSPSSPAPRSPSPPASKAAPTSSRPPSPQRRSLVLVAFAAAVVSAFLLGRVRQVEPGLPSPTSSRIDVRATPNVLVAVRDLSRLESATYHMERVVEMTDEQSKLFGLVKTRDSLLLVAVGDVTAGIDLRKVNDTDVTVDTDVKSGKRRARLVLPAPEIFSATLDSAKTHVFNRATDTFASRNEDLEGKARADAEASMRQAALDQGILARAKASAERDLRALLHSLGFEVVEIESR